MTPTTTAYPLNRPSDWKLAMHRQLRQQGMSRYAFIRECHRQNICSIHTGECLLADEGTITGQRTPSLDLAIAMAKVAGLSVTITPNEEA